MAITNNLSSLLTNTYAVPSTLNVTGDDSGDVQVKLATAAILTTDSIGSTYRMVQVSSADIITSIKLGATALTAGAISIGLYNPNTGTVVSVALFATAVSAAAAVTQVDQRYVNLSITTLGRRVWQLLGLAADPGLTYDLVYTSTTAATAAGTLTCQYDFTR